LAELKRRHVYRVAVGYAVVTWLLVQAASLLLATFEAPAWMMKSFVVAIALGFPVALVLAWAFEITPEGITSQSEIDHNKATVRKHGRKLAAFMVVLTIIAAGLFFFRIVGIERRTVRSEDSSGIPGSSASIPEKSIAVLPFENLSSDKENAYFADGVQDEILTNLAKVADLKVISRTSVMQYKTGAARNLREIGHQLGVAYLMEGSVQRASGKVRVNAQLIDARTDGHQWAQTYDRDLADVFAIQSEIAKAIADQLQAKLSAGEKAAMEEPPTGDISAFDEYSRAKSLLLTTAFSISIQKNYLEAIELLDHATGRDPSFFAAYCQLVYAHDSVYALGTDHTPARLALAQRALQTASRLRPDSAETHVARATHLYYALRDYKGAMAELEIARRGLANDPRIFELSGYILRRQGKHAEGLEDLNRAVELDPRNTFTLAQIAISYSFLRRYPDEAAVLDRALAIAPDDFETGTARALVDLYWKANPQPLHQFIERLRLERPASIGRAADNWFIYSLAERDWSAAEKALAALATGPFWADGAIVLRRHFGEGLLARATNDANRAREAFAAARLEQAQIVEKQTDYAPALCVLGLIDAALGYKAAALEEGKRAIDLLPLEKDSINAQRMIAYFAIIAAWAGEKDLALKQLSLSAPTAGGSSIASYGSLKLLPFWDPLRGDPRFEKIVADLAPK
jgi:TolB-like protein/Tfp pilus assembly protein PilF